jgi:hypothetical protein
MTEHVDFLIVEAAWSYMNQEVMNPLLNEKTSGISFNGDRTSFASRFIGPSKIAQRIREAGYTCQVISFVHLLDRTQIDNVLRKFIGPKTTIGISSTFTNGRGCKTIAMFMKDLVRPYTTNKNKTIIGGPSAHIWSKLIEKQGYKFDFVVTSFAENKIIDIANTIHNYGIGKKATSQWDITSCQHRWHPSSMILPGESLPLEAARGCIFECKFCRFTMLGKKKGTYVRDTQLLRDELMYNFENFGTINYMLTDDTFNDTPEKVEAWAEMVDRLPFKIQYVTYLRVDLIHRYPHTAALLQDSGLIATHFGIESLTPKASNLIGKAWSGKHARDYVPELTKNIWKDKINVFISLIAGLPYETEEDWHDAGKWAVDNNLSAYYATLGIEKYRTKFEGLWDNGEREGISYFDIHAEEYGYTFENVNGNSMWTLNGVTEKQVAQIVAPLNKYFDHNCRVSAWTVTELLTLGLPLDYILNNTRNVLYNDESNFEKRHQFVQRYYRELINV